MPSIGEGEAGLVRPAKRSRLWAWSPRLDDPPLVRQLPGRLMLFVSVAAIAVTIDIAARATLKTADVHPLFRQWWLFAVFLMAALIVRPLWGAGLAGLAAGGTLALSINGEMQVMGGIAWSPGFVFAFAGAVAVCLLLTAQLVWVVPAVLRKRLGSSPSPGTLA